MNTIRTIAIALAVLIAAVVALKIFLFVSSIIMTVITFLVFVGIVYVLFLVARSSLGRGKRQTPQI